jgi:hypothetical protein
MRKVAAAVVAAAVVAVALAIAMGNRDGQFKFHFKDKQRVIR